MTKTPPLLAGHSCKKRRMGVGLYLSVVFLSVFVFGLVQRGGLCRRAGATVCQPRLFKRPPVPHLRLGRGGHRLFPAALWQQLAGAAGGRHAAGFCPGVRGGLFAGETLPPKVVGLLRHPPQPPWVHLPKVQRGVGPGRRLDCPLCDASGPPAFRPEFPGRWAGCCWWCWAACSWRISW